MDESKDREQQGERNKKYFIVTYCILCGSENLHRIGGKRKGLYHCVDCGGKFRYYDNGKKLAVISWGDTHGKD